MKRASGRAAWVSAAFGLDPARAGGPPAWCDAAASALDRALKRGGVALVTGPSGAGKSAILRRLERRLRRHGKRVVRAAAARGADRAVIDLFRCSKERAMSLLARAGLAEAGVMLRRAGELSDGQRARLAVALAMSRAGGGAGATLIIDEFGSTLDRIAAMSLARTLRRWAIASRVRVVCATAHDDVLEWLGPEVLVEVAAGGPARVHRKEAA